MAQAEVITVRMSRGNLETSWGFEIIPPLTISNVIGGSLADRAGLLNGDSLVELEGHENLDLPLARQLLSKAEHKVELVVHRAGGEVHRIWKPSITENTEFSRFQHTSHEQHSNEQHNQPYSSGAAQQTTTAPTKTPTNVPLKVSLEHQNQASMNIPGFNVAAQPYGSSQEVKHLQYNSPMPLYSPQSAAEQYLQQTGGLFGTDPNIGKMKEQPSYLRSETLRLIQENEQSKGASDQEQPKMRSIQAPYTKIGDEVRSTITTTQNTSGPPQCFLCGRNILGVMCRAFDRTLHAECFQCATCGSPLKNQGHHFLNDKFYCDIHGRQLKGRQHDENYGNIRSTSAITTTTTTKSLHPQHAVGGGGTISPTVIDTRRNQQQQQQQQQENVRAFYQPEVMSRRPLSISPQPWKTQGPISPGSRAVPASGIRYGQSLRNESYTSTASKPQQQSTASSNKFGTTTTTQQQYQQQNLRQVDDSVKGRGTLETQGSRIPFCEHCKQQIRGAYVLANGLAWCPEHFVCANKACNKRLLDIGFVEDKGRKYCENCFENLIAPHCAKCNRPITADCLNALQKQWHPQCFVCAHCHKPFGNSAFFLEQGLPYCETDWNALFTTKCVSCHYPIEAGDRWVEALGSAFHSNCFNCTSCNVNLEGESFYAKNGAPYCKLHA